MFVNNCNFVYEKLKRFLSLEVSGYTTLGLILYEGLEVSRLQL